MTVIEPGQVWRSKDRRETDRTIRVDSVSGVDTNGVGAGFAHCTVLTPAHPAGRTGHTTRIRLLLLPRNYTLEEAE